MTWSESRVERLKQLWSEGKSANQIADELGDVTRNAVIGKAHRLKLESRPSPIPKRNTAMLTYDKEVPRCQWPIGNPKDPDFRYCGKQVKEKKPYCIEHCAEAYREDPTKNSSTNSGAQ